MIVIMGRHDLILCKVTNFYEIMQAAWLPAGGSVGSGWASLSGSERMNCLEIIEGFEW
jgi:hypothetical protein